MKKILVLSFVSLLLAGCGSSDLNPARDEWIINEVNDYEDEDEDDDEVIPNQVQSDIRDILGEYEDSKTIVEDYEDLQKEKKQEKNKQKESRQKESKSSGQQKQKITKAEDVKAPTEAEFPFWQTLIGIGVVMAGMRMGKSGLSDLTSFKK